MIVLLGHRHSIQEFMLAHADWVGESSIVVRESVPLLGNTRVFIRLGARSDEYVPFFYRPIRGSRQLWTSATPLFTWAHRATQDRTPVTKAPSRCGCF